MTIAPTGTWANGAAASSVATSLAGLTSYAANSSLSSMTANGSPAGSTSEVAVQSNGNITAVLPDGTTSVIGTIALATFASPEGLDRVGSNRYQTSTDSGTANVAAPGLTGRGTLRGSALENSTVDPTTEFVAMVRYQRGYQASSKALSTISELMNTTIQVA